MTEVKIEELARRLKPYMIDASVGAITQQSGDYAPYPHALFSQYHIGTLDDSQAPQFLKLDGTRVMTGDLNFNGDAILGRKAPNIVKVGAGDSFQSIDFTSGFVGWNINADGDAEFNNVNIRGEIHAAVFTYGEIHATAGTLGVFKSAGKLKNDCTSVTYPPNYFYVDVEDPDLGHVQLFAVNDICRIKDGSGADVWMTVAWVENQTTFYRYGMRKESGSNVTIRAGAAVVDYGPSGQGNITLSADGTVGSSANISIATHAGAPWSVQALQVRLGNLNGSYGISSNTFGIGIGDYSGGNYLRYDPTNGFAIIAGANGLSIDANGLIFVSGWTTDTKKIRWMEGSTNILRIGTGLMSSVERFGWIDMPITLSSGGFVRAELNIGVEPSFGPGMLFSKFYDNTGYIVATLYNADDVFGIRVQSGAFAFKVNGYGRILASTATGATAYNNADQTVTSGSTLYVALNSEYWDTDVIHDNSTNNSRLTCKTAGKYLVIAKIRFASNGSTGTRQVNIYSNAAHNIIAAQHVHSASTSVACNLECSCINDMAVNDYVEMTAFQDSGANCTLTYSPYWSPVFQMIRIA